MTKLLQKELCPNSTEILTTESGEIKFVFARIQPETPYGNCPWQLLDGEKVIAVDPYRAILKEILEEMGFIVERSFPIEK